MQDEDLIAAQESHALHGAWFRVFHILLVLLSALACSTPHAPASAQGTEISPGIFVCVDANGRRITSDRPIPECLGREQREVSATGVTRRVIPPSLTAEERAREEARAQQEAAQRAREADQKRKDRAMLARYPNQRVHDAEREKQLSLIDGAMSVIEQRGAELRKQQQTLAEEMEFYKVDPSKAPPWLKQRVADNLEQQNNQKRLLSNQLDEKRRIHARFDEELARLKLLWSGTVPP